MKTFKNLSTLPLKVDMLLSDIEYQRTDCSEEEEAK